MTIFLWNSIKQKNFKEKSVKVCVYFKINSSQEIVFKIFNVLFFSSYNAFNLSQLHVW